MARANKGGWDFIKPGGVYQYQESPLIAMVTVLEDNSTVDDYVFRVRVDKSNMDMGLREFTVVSNRHLDGYYSGMMQFYEQEVYSVDYKYHRDGI